jgi:hypothetical protein
MSQYCKSNSDTSFKFKQSLRHIYILISFNDYSKWMKIDFILNSWRSKTAKMIKYLLFKSNISKL